MSSTRHADPESPLRQERYASSPEIERGLLATAVARRCSVLDERADRELIWGLHFMSHQPGGLRVLVSELLTRYPERIGTAALLRLGKRSGNYTTDQVREVRKDLPVSIRGRFLLKGEALDFQKRIRDARTLLTYEDRFTDGTDAKLAKADQHPSSYSIPDFELCCREAAADGLENYLRELCLDPAAGLSACAPWYFAELVPTLRAFMSGWIAQRAAGVVVTALGSKVHETLDYTLHSRTLTLMSGNARTGKSFSARSWCEQHPGQMRYAEVATGNSEKAFFLGIARSTAFDQGRTFHGLGCGRLEQLKAEEIRERVESVLLTGDILLCLDEAQRLWPQVNQRYGFPKRIEWVMRMVNQGVPICLIATPQFIQHQKAVEQSGWASAQFIGRLGHYEPLPLELGLDDLTAVARFVLREADKTTVRALAAYARTSARYLAAIDTIAKRARYIAGRAGRNTATTADVQTAMKESVIPSDSKIARALQPDENKLPNPQPVTSPATARLTTPVESTDETIPSHRFGKSAALVGAE